MHAHTITLSKDPKVRQLCSSKSNGIFWLVLDRLSAHLCPPPCPLSPPPSVVLFCPLPHNLKVDYDASSLPSSLFPKWDSSSVDMRWLIYSQLSADARLLVPAERSLGQHHVVRVHPAKKSELSFNGSFSLHTRHVVKPGTLFCPSAM